MNIQPKIDIKKLEYKDNQTIKKLENEFNYDFYIPPFELREDTKSGIDWQLVNDQNYIHSAKSVGEIHDIVVAVCPEDPLKDSDTDMFRIHKRVMDGRTRYLSSKNANIRWRTKYIKVKDFEQFVWLWSHFNSLKGGNRLDEANKMHQLCIYRNKQGMEKHDVGPSILEQYGHNHPFNTHTLMKRIPKEYKRKWTAPTTAKKPEKKEPKKEKKIFKKDVELSKKDIEMNSLRQEIFTVQDQLKETQKELQSYKELKPFLTTPQTVRAKNRDMNLKVFVNLETKEFIINVE